MAFRTIGLEISTSAVRAVELVLGGQLPTLVNYHEVQLPPKVVQEGEIQNRPVVVERLRTLWEQGDFSQDRVQVGLAGLRAIIREVNVPFVGDKELPGAARFAAMDVIPFAQEKVLMDYRVLEDVTSPQGNPEKKLLVAAAHRDLVDPIIGVLEEVGLTATVVDLSSLALVRSSCHALGIVPDGAEAVVSVGAGLTVVVVHEQGTAKFVRTIGQGGDNVTEAIASALDAPFQDAEQVKWNLALASAQQQVALNAARDASTALINEIRSSVDYYNSISGRQEIKRVIITGGGSLLEGFQARLQQQFRIPVVPLQIVERLDISQIDASPEDIKRRAPFISTVVGLALPEAPGVKQINLVPPEVKSKVTQARTRSRGIAILIAVAVIVVGLIVWRFFQLNSASSQLNQDKKQIALLQSEVAQLNYAAKEHQQLVSLSQAIEAVVSKDVNWPVVNAELLKDTPPGGCIGVQYSDCSSITPSTVLNINIQPAAATQNTQILSNNKPIQASQLLAKLSFEVGGVNFDYEPTFVQAFSTDPMFTRPSVTSVTTSQSPSAPTGYTNAPVEFNAVLFVTNTALATQLQAFYSAS
jgi:type IV pilus assembly protein PilM